MGENEDGTLCASKAVRDAVGGTLGATTEPLGERAVKNIGEPVEVYRIAPPRATTSQPPGRPPGAAPHPAPHGQGLVAAVATAGLVLPERNWYAGLRRAGIPER